MAVSLDGAWAKNPDVSRETATWTLRVAAEIQRELAWRPVLLETIDGWLAGHPPAAQAPDIWSARDVALPSPDKLHTVVLAVWDVGVDPAVYPGRFAIDPAHVMAFDDHYAPSSGALKPVPPDIAPRLPQIETGFRGGLDIAEGRDTPAARAAADIVSRASAEDVPAMERGRRIFRSYVHGTAVAGVAISGNPAARILPIRIDHGHSPLPAVRDEAYAQGFVRAAQSAVAEMKARHARGCNISWGFTVTSVVQLLELHGLEPDPVTRKARAQRIFDTMFDGMVAAMRSAPEILFTVAAGNTDDDVNATKDLPGSIDLPNVLVVGAADQAGAPASFTSVGRSVRLYASGYLVRTFIPGGGEVRWSGSSLAAPQVLNAAGKLLAINPSITTAQLVKALIPAKSADPDALPLLDGKDAQAKLKLIGPS